MGNLISNSFLTYDWNFLLLYSVNGFSCSSACSCPCATSTVLCVEAFFVIH
jgi:hypothetical protein